MADNNPVVLFDSKDKCCACGACANACPVQAISMVEDEYGYEYPEIDNDKCIKCGRCGKVCQYKTKVKTSRTSATYAAAAKKEDILMSTASGGLFTTIAIEFIKNGGVAYGASMYDANQNISPQHIRAESLDELELLKGSKYVQSSIGDILKSVKNDLDSGRRVLFSGTPCQVAGLRLFLGKEYDNLFLIDIICHGVPSKKFFLDFINNQGKKMDGTISKFIFRDKAKGQGQTARLTIKTQNNTRDFITNGKLLSYFGLFLKQETYRDSCYKCLHTSADRNGDITLGDYWGIYIEHGSEVEKANLSNTKGISCVLVNTDKGRKLLDDISGDINSLESNFDSVCRHNDQLREPSKHTSLRTEVLDIYSRDGYASIDSYYDKLIGVKKLAYKIEFLMPKELKRSIKTIVHKIKG